MATLNDPPRKWGDVVVVLPGSQKRRGAGAPRWVRQRAPPDGIGVGRRSLSLLRSTPSIRRRDFGLAPSPTRAFDRDHVCVVNDAVDQGGRAAGVGEDRRPVLEGEVRGEDEALLCVPPADDLEEPIGVAVVEGEVAQLIELCRAARNVTSWATCPSNDAARTSSSSSSRDATRRQAP